MPKRGMPKIMSQACGFDYLSIYTEFLAKLRLFLLAHLSEPPPDLCDLERVLLTSVENIRFTRSHNLRYAR